MRLRRPMIVIATAALVCAAALVGCGRGGDGTEDTNAAEVPQILADTSFLADITRNVAGDEWDVSSLVPLGVDPHSFEPTPKDARRVAQSEAMVINATGLVPGVDDLVEGVGGSLPLIIDAAAGVVGVDEDPHCWLDPICVITYAENIAVGLGRLDPAGTDAYLSRAASYSEDLRELDEWILQQVDTVRPERRLLVTDHESFGRFADRYGFDLVGTVFPTTTGEGSPSARQLATLVDGIRTSGASAIFLESGASGGLAEQVAAETGIVVVDDLYTHSLGEDAPTYLEMMRWNVTRIVQALR